MKNVGTLVALSPDSQLLLRWSLAWCVYGADKASSLALIAASCACKSNVSKSGDRA
jgi:hypothetical protein